MSLLWSSLSSQHGDVAKMTFEEALRELEEIVKRLENIQERLSLEESIAAYERGTILRQHCEAKLQEAEMRIEKLVITEQGERNVVLDEEESVKDGNGGTKE